MSLQTPPPSVNVQSTSARRPAKLSDRVKQRSRLTWDVRLELDGHWAHWKGPRGLNMRALLLATGGPRFARYALAQDPNERRDAKELARHVTMPAGLIKRTWALLAGSGIKISFEKSTMPTFTSIAQDEPEMEDASHSGYMRVYPDLLTCLEIKIRGQIAVYEQDRVPVLAYVLNHLETGRVLVTTANWQRANQLADALKGLLVRPVTHLPREIWNLQGGVLICPAMTSDGLNSELFSTVIAVDVEAARSKLVLERWRFDMCRFYAILQADAQLDEEDQLRIEVTFGPEIYRIDHPAPIASVLLLEPCSYGPQRDQDDLERLRSHVWHNPARNRKIADLARALRNLDLQALRRAGLVLEEDHRLRQPPAVDILVGLPEHGRALKKLLPEWDLLTGYCPDSTGTEYLEVSRPAAAIISSVRAQYEGIGADVLIRADAAGPGRYQFMPDTGNSQHEPLIVDVQDDFDRQAKLDSQRRVRSYLDRNWIILNPPQSADVGYTAPETQSGTHDPSRRYATSAYSPESGSRCEKGGAYY